MMLSKILAFSSVTYLLFIIGNLGQLEIRGRFKISGSCVLALTNCQAEFVICDETGNLSKAEFNLINSILKRNFLEITKGNLKSIKQVPQIINNTVNMSTMAKPTTEAQTSSQNKDIDIVYLVETPMDQGELV